MVLNRRTILLSKKKTKNLKWKIFKLHFCFWSGFLFGLLDPRCYQRWCSGRQHNSPFCLTACHTFLKIYQMTLLLYSMWRYFPFRHIEVCNSVISQIQRNLPNLYYKWSFCLGSMFPMTGTWRRGGTRWPPTCGGSSIPGWIRSTRDVAIITHQHHEDDPLHNFRSDCLYYKLLISTVQCTCI